MKRTADWLRAIGWRRGVLGLLAVIAIAAPLWGPPLLSRMSFFRVYKVEIIGVRYLAPDEVFALLAVDTSASVWDDLTPLRERVLEHPQVVDVRISRRLPGTVLVRVTENLPVALVSSSDGMRAVDAHGDELPFDPSRVDVDLPLLGSADSVMAALLSGIRERSPEIFERISFVRRVDENEIVLSLQEFAVRAAPDLSPGRLADIIPVEEDLARRGARIAELDLRFRDQVIARVQ